MPKSTLRLRTLPEEEAEAASVRYQGDNCRQSLRVRGQVPQRVLVRLPIGQLRLNAPQLHAEPFHEANSSRAARGRSQFGLFGEHVSER